MYIMFSRGGVGSGHVAITRPQQKCSLGKSIDDSEDFTGHSVAMVDGPKLVRGRDVAVTNNTEGP